MQKGSEPPLYASTMRSYVASQEDVKKKDRNAQSTKLLELAMDWNCIDVAKELILKNSLDNILASRIDLDSRLHQSFLFRILETVSSKL